MERVPCTGINALYVKATYTILDCTVNYVLTKRVSSIIRMAFNNVSIGLCSMCGKKILDTLLYKQSVK